MKQRQSHGGQHLPTSIRPRLLRRYPRRDDIYGSSQRAAGISTRLHHLLHRRHRKWPPTSSAGSFRSSSADWRMRPKPPCRQPTVSVAGLSALPRPPLAESTEGETRLIQSYSATALPQFKSAAAASRSYAAGLGLDWDSLHAERRIGPAKRGVHHPGRARPVRARGVPGSGGCTGIAGQAPSNGRGHCSRRRAARSG
jgi:hypothetical protein